MKTASRELIEEHLSDGAVRLDGFDGSIVAEYGSVEVKQNPVGKRATYTQQGLPHIEGVRLHTASTQTSPRLAGACTALRS